MDSFLTVHRAHLPSRAMQSQPQLMLLIGALRSDEEERQLFHMLIRTVHKDNK